MSDRRISYLSGQPFIKNTTNAESERNCRIEGALEVLSEYGLSSDEVKRAFEEYEVGEGDVS